METPRHSCAATAVPPAPPRPACHRSPVLPRYRDNGLIYRESSSARPLLERDPAGSLPPRCPLGEPRERRQQQEILERQHDASDQPREGGGKTQIGLPQPAQPDPPQ